MLYPLEVLMDIDILIVDTPIDLLNKLALVFKGHCYWIMPNPNELVIKRTMSINDITSYSNLSEDDLATLEFLPDFDTRYTYLLSLSLGINA